MTVGRTRDDENDSQGDGDDDGDWRVGHRRFVMAEPADPPTLTLLIVNGTARRESVTRMDLVLNWTSTLARRQSVQ
jgi:hypothetical protein